MKHIGMATLGRDAEIRYTPSGDAVANLSLAVNYYDKNAENNRATQWVNATLWGKQAEALAQYMVKGSRHCFTLSDMHVRTYDRNDGGQGFSLEARVDSVELGPRQAGSGDGGGQQQERAPQQRQQPQQRQAPQSKPASGFDDMDDDIPF